MPSPSSTIGLTDIQSLLLPTEILVVFKLDRPASSRWLIDREHAIVDAIAGRDAIDAGATAVGDLLFRGISTAPGRPMLVVGDPVLRELPLESATIGGGTVGQRHSVTWFGSVEELVEFRRAEPRRIATRLRGLALAAGLAAALVVFRRVFWGFAAP